MRAYHNTREKTYRDPFGAVKTGCAVSLSLDVWDERDVECICRTWVDGEGESFITMEREELPDRARFRCTVKLDKPGLLWYSFIIRHGDISTWRYGAEFGRVNGVGRIHEWEPPSFQITVYNERKLPDWYRRGLVYQIFPDRFCRGDDWRELADKSLSVRRYGPQRALCEDWDKTPFYQRSPDRRITRWDFYGGTLSGIEKKLDYLKELGVTALYLNPIVRAASCHRYDTADYLNAADMLGGNVAFKRLVEKARGKGISIILDGVFNHTGCDSIYFNKNGNFDGPGAFQSEDSPYRDWYDFDDSPTGYRCWWGVEDMPEINEECESYRDFIFGGEDSVVRSWLRMGARGWRLDVADEMPDDFLEGIKAAAIKERGDDALVIGEVWEDASNKVAYGKLRRYLFGTELDSVMNYPLRDALLGFLTNTVTAPQLADAIESLHENYPKEAFYGALNLMGSHDRVRVMTILGSAPDEERLSEEQRRDYRLNESQRSLALGRSWLMTLVQMLLPGVPSIYYGDEAGMEGYSDPYNRGGYPWGHENMSMMGIYRNSIGLRKLLPDEDDVEFTPFSISDECFGFTRRFTDESWTVLINRSLTTPCDVSIPALGSEAEDIACGGNVTIEDGNAKISLYPMGSAVIRFTDGKSFAKKLERGSGVLCHITSVPNGGVRGNIGEPAKRFVDYLAASGQKYWQILPVNPTDVFGSPYAGSSAFAGNVELLPESEEELRRMFAEFTPGDDYWEFRRQNDDWLTPYALFTALKKARGDGSWCAWPKEIRHYGQWLEDEQELHGEAEYIRFCQYRFEKLWRELREYANAKGVRIIGDMPMYVSLESADAWSQPDMFTIEEGAPTGVAGVPPDWIDTEGQYWGNPLYDWDAHRKSGYAWWMRRFERMLDLYDYVRLDHFRGFESCWSIPAGEKPSKGRWLFGPGKELFETACRRFGPLPVLAEDLGNITPPVRALLGVCGLAGTDVVQFYNGDPLQGYVPGKGKAAYTGTHDNDTLAGWCANRYQGLDPVETARRLLDAVYQSAADVVITPLQDAMLLGSEARMNVPGNAMGNWRWYAPDDGLSEASERLLELTTKSLRR